MTVASAGMDQITVDGENGSPGALSILALPCSFRSHLLRLECAQGLLHSQVWPLAQMAGTVEAGQSSFLVASLSFLTGLLASHRASAPRDRRWKLCFSYRKWLSVTSVVFCWPKQS